MGALTARASWSEVHIQPTGAKRLQPTLARPTAMLAPSDQLAVTYALPIAAGASDGSVGNHSPAEADESPCWKRVSSNGTQKSSALEAVA